MRELYTSDKIVYLTQARDALTAKEKVISFFDRLILGKRKDASRKLVEDAFIARVTNRVDDELSRVLMASRGHIASRVREIIKEELREA